MTNLAVERPFFRQLLCAAMANPAICTGTAPDYYLRQWFGERGGITSHEIAAQQALAYANAAFAAMKKEDRQS